MRKLNLTNGETVKVKDICDRYAVDSKGNVYNHQSRKQLRLTTNKTGYVQVNLYQATGTKRVNVHRVIAMALIPNTESKREVNHIDGDKTNNSITNLEWCTRKENMEHAIRTGLMKSKKFANSN